MFFESFVVWNACVRKENQREKRLVAETAPRPLSSRGPLGLGELTYQCVYTQRYAGRVKVLRHKLGLNWAVQGISEVIKSVIDSRDLA